MPSGGSIHGSKASCDQDAGATALPPGAAVKRIRARRGSALREAVLQIAQAGAGWASGPCEEGEPEPSLLEKAGCCSAFVEHQAAASWSILEESDGDAGGSGADIACALVAAGDWAALGGGLGRRASLSSGKARRASFSSFGRSSFADDAADTL